MKLSKNFNYSGANKVFSKVLSSKNFNSDDLKLESYRNLYDDDDENIDEYKKKKLKS